MEKEQNHGPDHKMCDWCGNEYGRRYSWLRLVVAILIGLFIFSAGYHLGELNVLVHQSVPVLIQEDWHDQRMMRSDDMGRPSTTTITPAMPGTAMPAPSATLVTQPQR